MALFIRNPEGFNLGMSRIKSGGDPAENAATQGNSRGNKLRHSHWHRNLPGHREPGVMHVRDQQEAGESFLCPANNPKAGSGEIMGIGQKLWYTAPPSLLV
jgi:hypothetical protein